MREPRALAPPTVKAVRSGADGSRTEMISRSPSSRARASRDGAA
jgi:hypothetical protein